MFRLIHVSKLILFISVLLSALSLSGQRVPESGESSIELKTYVEQDRVPLNRDVVYQVELSWKGTLNQFEIENISEPVVTNLKLRSSGSSNKFVLDEQGNPRSTRRISYYFSPLEIGMAYIDGVIIRYEDRMLDQKSSLMAQRLGVTITEPVPEVGEGPFDIAILLWVLTIAFLGLVGFFVYRYLQRRKKEQAAEESKPKSLEEKYRNILHDTIHPTGGAPRETMSELVRLVNSYISEKAGISGSPDFHEIRETLERAGISSDVLKRINDFYQHSERSRFAGEPVSQSDLHLYYDTIELCLKQMNERTAETRTAEDEN